MPVARGHDEVSNAIAALKKVAPGADKKYRDAPVAMKSGGLLPPGLRGVAKLSGFVLAVKPDGFNKGKPYVAFRGVVDDCTDKDGRDYKGALFYTETVIADGRPFGNKPGKKAEAKVADVENTMKILGADLSDATYDDWNAIMKAVIDEGVYFHFRTWENKDNDRVNAEIQRKAENYTPSDDIAVVDNSEQEVPEEVETPPDDDTEGGGDEGNDNAEPSGDDDLTALAEKADDGDEDAAIAIQEKATEVGVNFESPEYANWASVVEAIQNASAEGSGDDEEPEEPKAKEKTSSKPKGFAKSDVVKYKPNDPKTKKPVKRAIECEITAIDTKAGKVTLKNLDDNKTIYKAVDISVLTRA